MKNTEKTKKPEKVKKTPAEIRKEIWRWVVDIFLIIVGGIMYSAGPHCFSAPNEIAPGGVAGISTLINAATGGMNIGILYGIINIPLIIIGFIFLGKKMMIKTLLSVAVVTFATDYGLAGVPIYENGDKMLAAICAGVLFGVGLGVV